LRATDALHRDDGVSSSWEKHLSKFCPSFGGHRELVNPVKSSVPLFIDNYEEILEGIFSMRNN